jgi:23S rRNA G2445 N2-methylase RlmL
MDIALLCDPGCEAVAALEVKELVGKDATAGKGYVTASDCTAEDIATLNYRSQSASRVIAVIVEGKISEPEDIVKEKAKVLDVDYSLFMPADGAFKVSAERHGEHAWQAHEVEEELGGLLHVDGKLKVDLDAPDMEVRVKIVDDSYVIGVDLTGRDLGKREYKAFHTRKSLRATIAYAAVRMAGYDGTQKLVDPFTTDAAIPIEASLFATKTPVQQFNKDFDFCEMPFAKQDWEAFFTGLDGEATDKADVTGFAPQVRTLKMGRGNAKLAGVDKAFTLTKVEVNWLDTKFDKESVGLIVTVPPSSGKNTPLKDVEKLQDDLFYQARYALKQEGVVLLITEKKAEFLNAAQRHKFSMKEEKEVSMGGTTLKFLVFRKQ